MDVCSIVLADDHVMFRQGVKRIIEETPGLEVVGEANDGLELLSLLKARLPELVILDISMPHLRGLEATREIKKLYPRVKVILLTMHRTREFLQQALEAERERVRELEARREDLQVQVNRAHRGAADLNAQLSNRRTRLEQVEGRFARIPQASSIPQPAPIGMEIDKRA